MKLFGILFLSRIPILLGLFRRSAIIKNGGIRKGLILLFESIQFEIDTFLRPQEEIFTRFQNRDLEEIGFLPLLRQEVRSDPCFALKRCAELLLAEGSFTEREREMLSDFCEHFGTQSKAAQSEDCQRLLSVLREEEVREREKGKTDASVSLAGGICLGIALFILLI